MKPLEFFDLHILRSFSQKRILQTPFPSRRRSVASPHTQTLRLRLRSRFSFGPQLLCHADSKDSAQRWGPSERERGGSLGRGTNGPLHGSGAARPRPALPRLADFKVLRLGGRFWGRLLLLGGRFGRVVCARAGGDLSGHVMMVWGEGVWAAGAGLAFLFLLVLLLGAGVLEQGSRELDGAERRARGDEVDLVFVRAGEQGDGGRLSGPEKGRKAI